MELEFSSEIKSDLFDVSQKDFDLSSGFGDFTFLVGEVQFELGYVVEVRVDALISPFEDFVLDFDGRVDLEI